MASAPVGTPPEVAGVADMVSVSVYPWAQSSRYTWVGPVGVFVEVFPPGYTRPPWSGSSNTVYVTFPVGDVSSVVRPSPSSWYVVVRWSPPPGGVVQPLGRLANVPIWLVSTSWIVFVTPPVIGSIW